MTLLLHTTKKLLKKKKASPLGMKNCYPLEFAISMHPSKWYCNDIKCVVDKKSSKNSMSTPLPIVVWICLHFKILHLLVERGRGVCWAGNSNSLKTGVDIEFFDDFYRSTHFNSNDLWPKRGPIWVTKPYIDNHCFLKDWVLSKL